MPAARSYFSIEFVFVTFQWHDHRCWLSKIAQVGEDSKFQLTHGCVFAPWLAPVLLPVLFFRCVLLACWAVCLDPPRWIVASAGSTARLEATRSYAGHQSTIFALAYGKQLCRARFLSRLFLT